MQAICELGNDGDRLVQLQYIYPSEWLVDQPAGSNRALLVLVSALDALISNFVSVATLQMMSDDDSGCLDRIYQN